MELLKSRSSVVYSVLSVVTLILVSFLILDCTRLLENYPWSSEKDLAIRADWAASWRFSSFDDSGESLYTWSNFSTLWWNDQSLHSLDPNWRGRHAMHDELRSGSIWYDEDVRDYFMSTVDARQFPSNCTKNTWIVHREHDSGLLSCTHVFFPIFSHGLGKGDGYTMIPVGQAEGHYPKELPTFDGCGKRKNRNLRCFYNITSCHVEDDPVRLKMLAEVDKSSDDLTGLPWIQVFNDSALRNGMAVFRSFEYDWGVRDEFHRAATEHRLQQWNELRQQGTVRVVGKADEAIEHVSVPQIDFVIHSMLSAWMIKQTSRNVKRIADSIMAKYADADGIPLWAPPVLAIHVRQTDKQYEDPYFRKTGNYRSVGDYAVQIQKLEKKYNFKWQSLFIISDSGTAMESLAMDMNDIQNGTAPDSANGREGKRFIMYDWSFDMELIERMGGHTHIPPKMKYSAQEHFLATLYIIGKIADYAIVQYSSNVGRFISELIGVRHRLSSADKLGPNAFSIDSDWYHD
ncbi:hypothetical protein MPTK1_1g06780 [Marchantia polymorpha subsp. ruderalis]|uniref:Uncharacterized protein n=2 Tax=Marchantia polymorpha TaxID=3197 RepID=A0AAF6AMB5_MARPO|nr:hypothetical protein MARPO_0043s0070 [Marchantia polymorpha]BBM97585.1 hypothetical protein Mp_1g06780 [Marchantia polymorpha subsp. ruderalis]|eukprot:PTQ39826.1 hypothetical protein MARPO_0043s0070 [Marchantia polymorpha]